MPVRGEQRTALSLTFGGRGLRNIMRSLAGERRAALSLRFSVQHGYDTPSGGGGSCTWYSMGYSRYP